VQAFKQLANGNLPEYVDGHQHVHILPGNILYFTLSLCFI